MSSKKFELAPAARPSMIWCIHCCKHGNIDCDYQVNNPCLRCIPHINNPRPGADPRVCTQASPTDWPEGHQRGRVDKKLADRAKKEGMMKGNEDGHWLPGRRPLPPSNLPSYMLNPETAHRFTQQDRQQQQQQRSQQQRAQQPYQQRQPHQQRQPCLQQPRQDFPQQPVQFGPAYGHGVQPVYGGQPAVLASPYYPVPPPVIGFGGFGGFGGYPPYPSFPPPQDPYAQAAAQSGFNFRSHERYSNTFRQQTNALNKDGEKPTSEVERSRKLLAIEKAKNSESSKNANNKRGREGGDDDEDKASPNRGRFSSSASSRDSRRGRGRGGSQAAQQRSISERMEKPSSEKSVQAQPSLSKRAKKRLERPARDFKEAEYATNDEMDELMERQRIAASAPAPTPASTRGPLQGRTYTMSRNDQQTLPFNDIDAAEYGRRGNELARDQQQIAASTQTQSPSDARIRSTVDIDKLEIAKGAEAELNAYPNQGSRWY